MTTFSAVKHNFLANTIRALVLFYWAVYWLFNWLDKLIGGSEFLWVGRDRFALFERFFASIGWASPALADAALIFTAGLEIFTFLFFAGALACLLLGEPDTARAWFGAGIMLTLSIFTFFAIGDQIFGDHAELLEHTLYWLIALFTWVIFRYADKLGAGGGVAVGRGKVVLAAALFAGIAVAANASIFLHGQRAYHERTDGVPAEQEGDNLYKCTFPFLAGSKSFENTLTQFKRQHPDQEIVEVYTVPPELRHEQADALIIYLTTQPKP